MSTFQVLFPGVLLKVRSTMSTLGLIVRLLYCCEPKSKDMPMAICCIVFSRAIFVMDALPVDCHAALAVTVAIVVMN